MFYLIYKITNNINGKIYIGSHKTKDGKVARKATANVLTLLATGTKREDLTTRDILAARREYGMTESKKLKNKVKNK
jgi:hypothetical protein